MCQLECALCWICHCVLFSITDSRSGWIISCTISAGNTPYDGVPNQEIATMTLTTTIIFDVLATFGIILSLVCLVFTLAFRKRRYNFSGKEWCTSFPSKY